MPAVAPVDVMLLGPPRVERDGAAVAFDTRKALALLAVLALADRPRPRDVLAELLWPEHDAEHARGALRRTLSALRSAVGPDFVDATRDQVSLVRGPGLYVDVDRFRALAGDGDVAGAAALFRGRVPGGLRAPRRARVRGLAARRGRRAAARARDACWRGWSRRPATWRSRSAGSSSTRCTSPRTAR